jgi:chloride channel protein, CIC family
VIGPISYAARTPGGLFAPMLTIGSQAGLRFGIVWCRRFNTSSLLPREFALVGMAAFSAAVVRAPITGIIRYR